MGWKCTPQIKGLVRGQFKKTAERKGKSRANGKAFFLEAGEERVSQSETLDRSRSNLNTYEGYTSGLQAWLDLEKEADEYQAPVHTRRRDKKTGEMKDFGVRYRKLKEDTVVGFAVIFNPPHDATHGENGNWDQKTYEKFYSDSWDCLHELYPELFRDENEIMSAVHRDEGYPVEEGYDPSDIDEHKHILGRCRDENGRWIGTMIGYKMFDNINANYPRMMRERGWSEMEDLDVTDRKRMKEDPEYKAERKKKKKFGKSTNKYIHDKTKENLRKSEDLLEQSEQLSKENQEKSEEIELTRSKQKNKEKELNNKESDLNTQQNDFVKQQKENDTFLQQKVSELAAQTIELNDRDEKLKDREKKLAEKEKTLRKNLEKEYEEKYQEKFDSEIESAKTDAKNAAWDSANQAIQDLKDDLQDKLNQAVQTQKEAEEEKKNAKTEALNEVQKKWYQELEAATPEYFNKFLSTHAVAVHPKDAMGIPEKDKWIPVSASKAFSHYVQQEASRTKSRVNDSMPEIREAEDQNEDQKQ